MSYTADRDGQPDLKTPCKDPSKTAIGCLHNR